MHVHRRLTDEDLEDSLVVREHRLGNSITSCLMVRLLGFDGCDVALVVIEIGFRALVYGVQSI